MRCAPCNLLVLPTHRLLPTPRLLQVIPGALQVTGIIHRFVRFARRLSSPFFLQSRQFAWRPRSLSAIPFDAHSTVLAQPPAVRSNSNLSTATTISPPPLRPNPSQSDYNSAQTARINSFQMTDASCRSERKSTEPPGK